MLKREEVSVETAQFMNSRHSTGRMALAAECAGRGCTEGRLPAQISFTFAKETDFRRRVYEAAFAQSYDKSLARHGGSVHLR